MTMFEGVSASVHTVISQLMLRKEITMWRIWRVIDPRKAIVLSRTADCFCLNIDSSDSDQWRSLQHQQLASRYGSSRSGESQPQNAALPQK